MFNDILALLIGDGTRTAVYTSAPGAARVGRRQLVHDIEVLASAVTAADRDGGDAGTAWVSCRDRYLFVVAVLGGLRTGPVALAEAEETTSTFEAMAASCPPAVVLTDDAGTAVARWARARGVRVRLVGRPAAGRNPAGRPDRGTGPSRPCGSSRPVPPARSSASAFRARSSWPPSPECPPGWGWRRRISR